MTCDRRRAEASLAELLSKQPAADGLLPEIFQPAYSGWAKYAKSSTPGARKIREQSTKWYGRYRDRDGALKIEPLDEIFKLAQAMLVDKQRTASKQRAGFADDFTHLEELRDHLKAGNNTDKHAEQTDNRVLAAMQGCRFTRLSDMRASKLELWLERERGADRIGNKTSNYYLGAIKQFGRWLVKDGRMPKNPFEHIDTVKAEEEYERRPLSAEEFEWLVVATSNSSWHHRRLSGVACWPQIQDSGRKSWPVCRCEVSTCKQPRRLSPLKRATRSVAGATSNRYVKTLPPGWSTISPPIRKSARSRRPQGEKRNTT